MALFEICDTYYKIITLFSDATAQIKLTLFTYLFHVYVLIHGSLSDSISIAWFVSEYDQTRFNSVEFIQVQLNLMRCTRI